MHLKETIDHVADKWMDEFLSNFIILSAKRQHTQCCLLMLSAEHFVFKYDQTENKHRLQKNS